MSSPKIFPKTVRAVNKNAYFRMTLRYFLGYIYFALFQNTDREVLSA